jgi:2-phosphoglycolate phosphatase
MIPRLPARLAGVFFDLDGTLLDSARDLYAALVDECHAAGVAPPPFAPVREVVSRGSRAILRVGFPADDDAAIEARAPAYLARYLGDIARHTMAFDGIDAMLRVLEGQGIAWGIVTNKPGFLTDALLPHLGYDRRAASVVSGDTLPVKKPDPAPVLLACARAGVDPGACIFVGDDRRDIQAGQAAGMPAIAVTWGYLDGGNPADWQADAVVDTPWALLEALGLAAHA